MNMLNEEWDGVFVILPLFDRPVRASLTVAKEVHPEQLRTLAAALPKHLQALVLVVDRLKRSGWEVLGGETSLICRHPSVRTKAQAELAFSLLGIDFGLFSVSTHLVCEQHDLTRAENEDLRKDAS